MPDVAARRVVLDATPGPLHPVARDTLLAALDAGWADPRRLHREGRQARHLLDQARGVIADGLGRRAHEVCFLPSGWALPLALDGLRHARRRVGDAIVASAVEQRVVLERDGVTTVPVDRDGRVDASAYAGALTPQTALAVLQTANGEVGTTQPVAQVAAAAAARGVPLLVDASASLGRVGAPRDGDIVVGDAATFGGPPLGILIVRDGVRFALPGPRREAEHGYAEQGPWVPLALAAAEAWQQSAATRADDDQVCRQLIDGIRAAVATLPGVDVVGDPGDRLPHVLTFSALYLDGEALVRAFDVEGFAVSSGSACTSSLLEPSHVLAAMGALTHGNVRITLPAPSTTPGLAEDVARFGRLVPQIVNRLRVEAGVDDL